MIERKEPTLKMGLGCKRIERTRENLYQFLITNLNTLKDEHRS
jgi:hypothetical protein